MNSIERDCIVGRCCSAQHGGQLAALATMRASNPLLAAYMRWLCGNFGRVTDSSGRTALHLAASCGHDALVHWLVRKAEVGIDTRDAESGYTPLHRSIFYGQIHVATELIKMGASLTVRDRDGLTPIDHAMKDRPAVVEFDGRSLCEVYVWGTNSNYSLGTGNQQSRSHPELLDCFRKQGISIKQVAMHKFHSVFVSHDGRVFSCGHGQGGRLGLGSEGAALLPCVVQMQTTGNQSPDASAFSCAMATVGRDHTVLLMDNGSVWSCGLNTYHQLGHSPPPPKLLSPRQIPSRFVNAAGESVTGICATRFHTIIWGQKAVLTCGLNAGQLGHPKGTKPTITCPKLVSALTHKPGKIIQVASSDGAVAVAVERCVTNGGLSNLPFADIYILQDFKCQKIATRHVGVMQLAVVGGHLDVSMLDKDLKSSANSREDEHQLQVLMLDNKGHLFLWQENITKELVRCIYSVNRSLMVTAMTAQTRGQVLLITRDGEAFEGELKVQRSGMELTTVRIKRLPHIHRAVTVTSDPKGRNFAIVQAHPIASLLEVPQMESSNMKQHMSSLLNEASDDDLVHDVVFKVGTTSFPAHRYIIASRCEMLAKRIADISVEGDTPIVEIKDARPDVFKQILQFIYTNQCSILQPGDCPLKVIIPDDKDDKKTTSKKTGNDDSDPYSISSFDVHSSRKNHNSKTNSNKQKSGSSIINPVRIMLEAAKRFGLSQLVTELEKIRYEDGKIIVKEGCRMKHLQAPCFKRLNHEHLYDVKIRCDDEKELQAHKCVLTARLEYFNSMLSGQWIETSGNKGCKLSLPLPYHVLEVLIDFLYTDSTPVIQEWDDLDFVSNVLVVADQLFIGRLKEAAEVSLANMLTLRNVGHLLQLSGTYNADQLKQCCMQYITFNMPAVLESRILESVSKELLADLTKYYCEFIPAMNRRIITPYSTAPNLEVIQSISDAYPVPAWDNEDDSSVNDEEFSWLKKGLKSAKKKGRTRKSSTGESGANRGPNSRARNESVGSNNSWGDEILEDHHDLDISDLIEKSDQSENITLMLSQSSTLPEENESSFIKILNKHERQQEIVQARLRAASKAKEIEQTPSSLVRLIPRSEKMQNSGLAETAPIAIPFTSADFFELTSSPPYHEHSRTPRHQHWERKKLTKLSQKQRKKQIAEQKTGSPEQRSASETVQPAWGNLSRTEPELTQSFSLLDIMRQEMQQMKGPQSPPSHMTKGPHSPPTQMSTSPGLGGSNPWLKGLDNSGKSPQASTDNSTVSFSDIVADEKKQKENWIRMRAKPLQLTQLEDQAIEDLLVFYNAAGSADEHITVKRVVSVSVAPPTWITSHH